MAAWASGDVDEAIHELAMAARDVVSGSEGAKEALRLALVRLDEAGKATGAKTTPGYSG